MIWVDCTLFNSPENIAYQACALSGAIYCCWHRGSVDAQKILA